jgi:hypothetical protein
MPSVSIHTTTQASNVPVSPGYCTLDFTTSVLILFSPPPQQTPLGGSTKPQQTPNPSKIRDVIPGAALLNNARELSLGF